MEVREPFGRYFTPASYRQSEIGPIPKEWEVIKLASRASIQSGIAKNANATVRNPVSVPYLRVANVQDGYLDLDEVSSIDIDRADLNRYAVMHGDVLMNEGGDLDKLGRGALWRGHISPCVHQNHVFVVRCKDGLVPEYLNAWTSSAQARRYFMLAGRQTTNLASINKTSLGDLTVAVPPTNDEQHKIANALTDADVLIDSLEQLLTRKRQMKQGAMQDLLTGKRRLPGFTANWETKRLGRLLKFQTGFPFPSPLFCSAERGLRLIRNRDLKSNDDVVHFGGAFDGEFVVKRGDVLVGMDGDFMPCLWDGEDALLNQRVGRVLPREGLDPTFAYYFLIGKLKTIEASTGSTTVKHLSHGDVEGIEAAVPELAEQIEIGASLRDLDLSITALESRLTKARALKQAMAQALLTGRIRLVEPVA